MLAVVSLYPSRGFGVRLRLRLSVRPSAPLNAFLIFFFFLLPCLHGDRGSGVLLPLEWPGNGWMMTSVNGQRSIGGQGRRGCYCDIEYTVIIYPRAIRDVKIDLSRSFAC
jgi:hypothetical protein